MPLDEAAVRARTFEDRRFILRDIDCMLYALTIGVARDGPAEGDLDYVFEESLRVFPTMPVVMGHPGIWMIDPSLGITLTTTVHASQWLELHGEVPIGVPLVASHRMTDVIDKGERGAIVVPERTIRSEAGELVARMESGAFCRSDGGFGGKRHAVREFRTVPQRKPDALLDVQTDANQALYYRLNGDRNPLHASPEVAQRAGFERPILHGLCTYAIVANALMRRAQDKVLRSFEARFVKPVFPGELLRVEAWFEPDGTAFRARVREREAVVLDAGFATFS